MKHHFIFIVCLVILLTLPAAGTAREVTLASVDWKPYAARDLPNYGFTAEIIAAAFDRAGHTARFEFYPWKRAMMVVRHGETDALFSAYPSDERVRTYAVSAPYAHSPLVLCAVKGNNIEYTTLRDLAPYRLGVVDGYVNTPEFDAADYLKKDPVTSDQLNLKKLIRGRLDAVVIDKYVAIHIFKNDPALDGDLSTIYFVSPPLATRPLHVMFSRAIPDHEAILDDFNRGLEAIEADGTIDEILRRHGFLNP